MSNKVKAFVAIAVLSAIAACAQQEEEEFIVVDPEPISIEPTYTGKLK